MACQAWPGCGPLVAAKLSYGCGHHHCSPAYGSGKGPAGFAGASEGGSPAPRQPSWPPWGARGQCPRCCCWPCGWRGSGWPVPRPGGPTPLDPSAAARAVPAGGTVPWLLLAFLCPASCGSPWPVPPTVVPVPAAAVARASPPPCHGGGVLWVANGVVAAVAAASSPPVTRAHGAPSGPHAPGPCGAQLSGAARGPCCCACCCAEAAGCSSMARAASKQLPTSTLGASRPRGLPPPPPASCSSSSA